MDHGFTLEKLQVEAVNKSIEIQILKEKRDIEEMNLISEKINFLRDIAPLSLSDRMWLTNELNKGIQK